MTSTEKQIEEKAFEEAFYGIPDSITRSKMSPEKLAIHLSMLNKGTPAYILLEHELNLRLTAIQAKATRSAALAGIFGAVLGAVVTSLFG